MFWDRGDTASVLEMHRGDIFLGLASLCKCLKLEAISKPCYLMLLTVCTDCCVLKRNLNFVTDDTNFEKITDHVTDTPEYTYYFICTYR